MNIQLECDYVEVNPRSDGRGVIVDLSGVDPNTIDDNLKELLSKVSADDLIDAYNDTDGLLDEIGKDEVMRYFN